LGPWGDTPYPAPSFVVTHEARDPLVMKSAAFPLVTGGVASAVAQARAAAGGRAVIVLGAEIARPCLAAALVDELSLQLVPVLLGSGTRLFDGVVGPIDLAPPSAIHLTLRPIVQKLR